MASETTGANSGSGSTELVAAIGLATTFPSACNKR